MKNLSFVIAASVLATACSAPAPTQSASFPGGELVDLSHVYDETTVFWPTSETFRLEKTFDGMTPGGYYFNSQGVLLRAG